MYTTQLKQVTLYKHRYYDQIMKEYTQMNKNIHLVGAQSRIFLHARSEE